LAGEGNAIRILADLLSENPDLETTKNFCWLPDLLPAADSDACAQSGPAGAATLVRLALQYDTPLSWRVLAMRANASALELYHPHAAAAGETHAEDEGFVCCEPRHLHVMGGEEATASRGAVKGAPCAGGDLREPTAQVMSGGACRRSGADGGRRHLVPALGEAAMRELKEGDVIELAQKGFFRVDSVLQRSSQGRDGAEDMRLISIPSGMVVRRYQPEDSDSSSSDGYDNVSQEEMEPHTFGRTM
jgi:hypothetical protein